MSSPIVVTGLGIVSSIGVGVDQFEDALFASSTGIGNSRLVGLDEDAGTHAFEVRDFEPSRWLGKKGLRLLDRTGRLLCVAAHLSLASSGLTQPEGSDVDPRLGLICGTMFGSVHSIASFDWSGLTEGPKFVNPSTFPNTVINSCSGNAAIKHRLGGVNSTLSAGLSSGLYSISYAAEFLRLGRADTLLAGGVEELCQESHLGFERNGFNSARAGLRPFASDRDGTVLGEGAALWAMETEERARARGVDPMLEIAGFGAVYDAYRIGSYRVTADGAIAAVKMALEEAGIDPQQIAFIVSGANGSRAGDRMENRALQNVFGDRLPRIPICAPKAAFGEALGASGALLAATAGLGLTRQTAPPTAGFRESEYDLLLSANPQPAKGQHALVSCFGCDGNNAALVLKTLR